ncbi:hypothetical protein HDU77_003128 [Chytriomyces hyalinus]|nr:hypothetical protein HDU77_003128 [Chytriomyces hyalinus]
MTPRTGARAFVQPVESKVPAPERHEFPENVSCPIIELETTICPRPTGDIAMRVMRYNQPDCMSSARRDMPRVFLELVSVL